MTAGTGCRPGHAGAGVPHGGLSYAALSYRVRRGASEIGYTVETSEDLVSWETGGDSPGRPECLLTTGMGRRRSRFAPLLTSPHPHDGFSGFGWVSVVEDPA